MLPHRPFCVSGQELLTSTAHRRKNDFSVGEAKIGEKQSRQSNSITQYVFLEKGIRSVQWGLGQSPRSWGNFREFLC